MKANFTALVNQGVNEAARATHEANRILCIALGDYSQPVWEEAPDWQKQSAVAGIQAVVNNPRITPAQLHQAWLDMKSAEGWKYGRVKDVDKKEHPCFLPYDQLPPQQQLKDQMFSLVSRSALGLP